MSINFFEPDCRDTTSHVKFGLCDGGNDTPAYIELDESLPWICTVCNDNSIEVELWAIDHCVTILRNDGDMTSRCDCMFTYPDNIVFVELKEKRANWIEEGIRQIEQTLDLFPSLTLSAFKHKRAFVANRKHPHFHVIEDETMRRFFSKHRVRLNVEAEIIIR